MSKTKAKEIEPPLLLFFAVPEKVNVEDRRYAYRQHLRDHGFEDKDATIEIQENWNGPTFLYVSALNPFLCVLKYLPYRLTEAKLKGKDLTLTFKNYDNYEVMDVTDRGSMPARILEALVYFAFEDFGVRDFKALPCGDVEIVMERYYIDFPSPFRTNGPGYTMVTAIVAGLGENRYWLEQGFKEFYQHWKH